MNLNDRILAIREGGQTQRCHTMQYLGPYNVAIHSYNALNLLLLIYPGEPSLNLIKAVQWHDTPERWTGDVPTPAKMAESILRSILIGIEAKILDALQIGEVFKKLTQEERNWLTAVDLLELYIWANEQAEMGNKIVCPLITQILIIFNDRASTTPGEVYSIIENFKWNRTPECHELIGDENAERN
jgi:hypothetical protein